MSNRSITGFVYGEKSRIALRPAACPAAKESEWTEGACFDTVGKLPDFPKRS